ncbi:hypothetical protein LX81_02254 [Palleronia aestuarii]|uniref:CAF17 C-terminal domain-containing protein n=1 Tax=Palleronia aestuarii TaxID=568105 RepID=A0A2W7NH23_9RHOB|nr:folate-binding protein YgfZ [Palleronia aestuarii]PZX15984.1 hypothetical protein LX81_02254 [Palleronia aestuarii]
MTNDRTILSIEGRDRVAFLQDLVTNDITHPERMTYAALLTPQGKYLADFFVVHDGGRLLLDVATALAPALAQRLSMYRLRRDVKITETDLRSSRGTGEPPAGAFPDPRHPELGWRRISESGEVDDTDWDALRVAHCIPEAGHELVVGESYPLEMGFDRLNGVDFRKGCYVGQEVTARMKHKTELKKGLAAVALSAPVPPGTEITSGGRTVGTVHTQSGGRALAYLRFGRAGTEPLEAGGAEVTLA